MGVSFIPVKTTEDQRKLAELAGAIWNEYWPAIIGQDQTNYMVEQFQSFNAITRDMAAEVDGYEYWFIVSDGESARADSAATAPHIVGYTGGHNETATNRFFVSKIYLLHDERGKGYASAVIKFYEHLCVARGLHAMYLTVNKYNEMGIRAYKAKGFVTIDSVETSIGEGFIMDDYIMEKVVE